MGLSSIPKPDRLSNFHPFTVRSDVSRLRYLHPPATLTPLPSLPSLPRPSNFTDSYELSAHIFPAAYPRRYPEVPLPELPRDEDKNNEKRKKVKKAAEEICDVRFKYQRGELDKLGPNKHQQWCSINRLAKRSKIKSNDGKERLSASLCTRSCRSMLTRWIAILLNHSTGFTKEVRHLASLPLNMKG
jgi:hypothetical protein